MTINLKNYFSKLLAAFVLFSVLKSICFFIQWDCLNFSTLWILVSFICKDKYNSRYIIALMKYVISFVNLNLELISLHHQLLFHIRQRFFYNNLTAFHQELKVFLELMDNHCVIHVTHQVIQYQFREYILPDYFYWLSLHQIYQHFLTI